MLKRLFGKKTDKNKGNMPEKDKSTASRDRSRAISSGRSSNASRNRSRAISHGRSNKSWCYGASDFYSDDLLSHKHSDSSHFSSGDGDGGGGGGD